MSTARHIVSWLLEDPDEPDMGAYAGAAIGPYPDAWAEPIQIDKGLYTWSVKTTINGVPASIGFTFHCLQGQVHWYMRPFVKFNRETFSGGDITFSSKFTDLATEADAYISSRVYAASREIERKYSKPIRGQFPTGVPVNVWMDEIRRIMTTNVIRGSEPDRLGVRLT